jgi:hypothetical protein
MSREMRTIIRWMPADRGGRARPPSPVAGYTAPARFESDPAAGLGSWSLRILDATDLHGDEVIEARVALLAPDAPQHLLDIGQRFELLEGRNVVAKGVVLSPTLKVPATIGEFELALLG